MKNRLPELMYTALLTTGCVHRPGVSLYEPIVEEVHPTSPRWGLPAQKPEAWKAFRELSSFAEGVRTRCGAVVMDNRIVTQYEEKPERREAYLGLWLAAWPGHGGKLNPDRDDEAAMEAFRAAFKDQNYVGSLLRFEPMDRLKADCVRNSFYEAMYLHQLEPVQSADFQYFCWEDNCFELTEEAVPGKGKLRRVVQVLAKKSH